MAANPGPSRKLSTKTDESEEKNERLNIYSEKFDPLEFLRSDKAKIPIPKAKVYDNLAQWHSHYQRDKEMDRPRKKQINPGQIERKWLPHQLPTQSTKEKRIMKNVFTRMDTVQGPMALLRKYVEEKARIKIVTRNDKGIRGYCIATLLAFDKHFNFILEEVSEVWRRSIRVRRNAVFLDFNDTEESDAHNIQTNSRNRVKLPKIDTKKISKNTEECRRYVDQMLMRGEHVVMVYVASTSDLSLIF